MLGQLLDDEMLNRVARKLDAYGAHHGVSWPELGIVGFRGLLDHLDEVFEEDEEDAAAFAGWMKLPAALRVAGERKVRGIVAARAEGAQAGEPLAPRVWVVLPHLVAVQAVFPAARLAPVASASIHRAPQLVPLVAGQ